MRVTPAKLCVSNLPKSIAETSWLPLSWSTYDSKCTDFDPRGQEGCRRDRRFPEPLPRAPNVVSTFSCVLPMYSCATSNARRHEPARCRVGDCGPAAESALLPLPVSGSAVRAAHLLFYGVLLPSNEMRGTDWARLYRNFRTNLRYNKVGLGMRDRLRIWAQAVRPLTDGMRVVSTIGALRRSRGGGGGGSA